MKKRAFHLITIVALIMGGFVIATPTFAQNDLVVDVTSDSTCLLATFTIDVVGGSGVHDLNWDFGDDGTFLESGISDYSWFVEHEYPYAGLFNWSVLANDVDDPELTNTASGSIWIGPLVTLSSDVFPPILTLDAGVASLNVRAVVEGGSLPYDYAWEVSGDGTPDYAPDPTSDSLLVSFNTGGTYVVSVTVTDECGLSHTDTLTIVVFDPEEACHPRAQQIAQAVSSIFPGLADNLYSCEAIFGIFNGDLTGSQLGFGNMWHAYTMAVSIDELTWEEVLDWKLNESGWGGLAQLDKFSDALEEIGIGELMDLVFNDDASINEIHTAVRTVILYDADFYDVLDRFAEGASNGEVGQFYRLAHDLELDTETLDGYIETGLSISDIRHAAKIADSTESDLPFIAAAHADGLSWGEISQAFRLADEDATVEQILDMGVQEFRQLEHDQAQEERQEERNDSTITRYAERYGLGYEDIQGILESCDLDWACVREQLREQDQENQQLQQDQRTAEQLARQNGVEEEDVWALFDGECSGDWNCVRQTLRENESQNDNSNGNPNQDVDRDQRTAEQIARKYDDVTVDDVWSIFNSECGGEWNCVRQYFRDSD